MKNLCSHLYSAGKALSLTCMKQDFKDFKYSSPCLNKASALMVSTGKRQILSTVAQTPLTSKQTREQEPKSIMQIAHSSITPRTLRPGSVRGCTKISSLWN